jgi:hypothetical protein
MISTSEILAAIELADVVLAALAGSGLLSEILPFIGKWKSNGVLHMIVNVLRDMAKLSNDRNA